jgi:predicted dehydrogenase
MVFRAGIVGCGLMGTLHARTLAALPDVQVAAVQNHTPAKADTLAAEVDARRFDSVEELVRSDVDAVWVCTPDFAHVEPSLAVLEAGKHLFLEKSLATTLEDGRTILRAAESHPELKALLGYPLRFDPRYQRMKDILSEPDAGRTAMAWSLRTHFLDKTQRVYDKYRDEYYEPPAWYWREDLARGPIYSHASHDYDLLSWFCGPIERVFVYGGTYLLEPGDVADGFTVSLRFASGAVATVSTPWVTRVEYDFVGVATQGLTVTNQNGALHLKRAGAASEEVIAFENPDMWVPMATHFIRCIQDDQPPLVSIADGYRAIAVATAAYRSLKEGKEMIVDPQLP